MSEQLPGLDAWLTEPDQREEPEPDEEADDPCQIEVWED